MVCALFDLQYMLDDVWDTIKLNKMDEDLMKFFKIIEHVDDAMHDNMLGHYDKKTGKIVWRKKEKGEYLFGKPRWKKLK